MFANDVLDGLGHVGVIEPSCGTGSFLSAIPQHLPAYGVDIDPDIAAVAKANSGRQVIIGDFRSIELPEQDVSRSEEQKSELQSLKRHLYAVFWLEKKKDT